MHIKVVMRKNMNKLEFFGKDRRVLPAKSGGICQTFTVDLTKPGSNICSLINTNDLMIPKVLDITKGMHPIFTRRKLDSHQIRCIFSTDGHLSAKP